MNRRGVRIATLIVVVLGGGMFIRQRSQPTIPTQLCMAGGGFGPYAAGQSNTTYSTSQWQPQGANIDPAVVVTPRFGLPLVAVNDAGVYYHGPGDGSAPTVDDPRKVISILTFVFSHDPPVAPLQCLGSGGGPPRTAFAPLLATGSPPPLIIMQQRITSTPPVAFPFAPSIDAGSGDVMATWVDQKRRVVLIAVGDKARFRSADVATALHDIAAH